MTLEKAKEIIAEKHYGGMYKWEDLFDDIKLRLMDEVSFLYAHSKWNEACEAQVKEYLKDSELKPEFKP